MLAGTVNEYFYKVHVINYDNFIDSLNKLAESDLKNKSSKKGTFCLQVGNSVPVQTVYM